MPVTEIGKELRIKSSKRIRCGSHDLVVFKGRWGRLPFNQPVVVQQLPRLYRDFVIRDCSFLFQICTSYRKGSVIYPKGFLEDDNYIYFCVERYNCTLLDLVRAEAISRSKDSSELFEPQLVTAKSLLNRTSLWQSKKYTQDAQVTRVYLY
ncbi:OLC1v1028464C1 [Oldenlandia corymbosa var. corymbosa]|uniref:OLC1v1028464C1 n=1 Tax=Oldenlandia corymbosa var. corymbosa TaxID=529605 RepID=A0AAV1CEE8_OLDCO|nr:OLC1v1028464C1 [Oldenlandia corymbosa var. corymbosa]